MDRHFHIGEIHIWDAGGRFGTNTITEAHDVTEGESHDGITAGDGGDRSPIYMSK